MIGQHQKVEIFMMMSIIPHNDNNNIEEQKEEEQEDEGKEGNRRVCHEKRAKYKQVIQSSAGHR